MQTDNTNAGGKWYSVNEALNKLGISRNTLYAKIKTNEIQNQKEGKYRLVWIDENTPDMFANQTVAYTNTNGNNNREQDLKEQLSYFKQKVDTLEIELSKQREELSKQRERHDTIIASITQNNQMLLAESRKPFWKFW